MKRLLTSPEIAGTTKYYVLVSAYLFAMISIAQYWDLFGVNTWFTPLYRSEQDVQDIMLRIRGGYPLRISGTMGNANIYGVVLVWVSSFIIASYRNTQMGILSFVYLLGFLLLILAGALTQSRSTLGLLVIIWVLTLFTRTRHQAKRNFLSFRTVVLIILIAFAVWGLGYWVETSQRRFGSRLMLSTSSTQTSYRARVRDLVRPIYQTLDAPLSIPFGRGPSKTALRSDSHNGYTWILLRFGIVGVALYLGILMTILRRGVGSLNAEIHQEDRAIVLFGFLTVCVWILVEFTNAIFKLPSLMALNMFSAGWLSAEMSKGLHTHLPIKPSPFTIPIAPHSQTGVSPSTLRKTQYSVMSRRG